MKKQITVTFLSALMAMYSPVAFANKNDSFQPSSGAKAAPTPAAPVVPVGPSIEYVRVKMGKSIFLDPPESDEPSVYVRIRDTSGSDFDIQSAVKGILLDNGFTPVRNAKKADYVLQANMLFAEEVSEAELQSINESDYDQSIGDVIASAAGGAALGGVVDVTTGDHNTLGAGSAVGAVLGIISSVSSNAQKKRELANKKATKLFSAVIDIEVRQRAEGEVIRRGTSKLSQTTESDTQSGSLTDNSSFGESDVAQTQERDEYTSKSKWVRYRARVIASAKGKHITLEDVKSQITDKVSKAISGMF